MGDIKGFLKVKRKVSEYRPVCERVKDYSEVCLLPSKQQSKDQASRCMDCGTPFCHWGCPIGNYIPEWNDLIFRGQLEKARQLLSAMNNFPEITGRICPAHCEYACVLGINDDPVTIRDNELSIIEDAFKKGIIRPNPPKRRTHKNIAVIGSGPGGLACADQLNKRGHSVTVFEKDDKIGGIMRYGIPDFKLEKWVLDRRINILKKEGINFKTKVNVGFDGSTALTINPDSSRRIDYPVSRIRKEFDAVCLACGCRVPRDLSIEGRRLSGIYFAMDYLLQSNRRVAGEKIAETKLIDAKGKKVVVIGAGDTGSDCVGTAHRQGASCVVQIELLVKPAERRTKDYPWPMYPLLLKTSISHEEGGAREWSVLTKKFSGQGGCLKKLSCVRVEFKKDESGCPKMSEVRGSEFEIEADLVILALGFLHPEKKGLIEELQLELDAKGNVKTGDNFMTSQKAIFACADMHRGQSLIVWAICEGRKSAHFIDKYLMGESSLPLV
jgi:glutamate synthase (NADPH) small chain